MKPVQLKEGVFIKDWLLLGPFPNCEGCDVKDFKHGEQCAGFATDFLTGSGGEAKTVPRAGQPVKILGTDRFRRWFAYHSEGDRIPLNDILTPNDLVIAYAFTRILSPQSRKIILSVGSNDGVKVFLNGIKIHQVHPANGRWLQKDDDFVPVTLKKGVNNLMLKIDEGTGDFGFAIRFLDYDSTLQALRQDASRYSKLSLIPHGDSLLVRFGESYRLSVFNPAGLAHIWLKDRTDRIIAQWKLPMGAQHYFPLSRLPEGMIWAVAKFDLGNGDVISNTARFYNGKLERHALPAMMDGALLLPKDQNGKVWFPIGTYGAPVEDFARLKAAGYNFVVASPAELDKVEQAGLKAAVSLHGDVKAMRDLIEKYRHHPGVLCWMLYDEPAYNEADLLFIYSLYQAAYEADPVHPSYIVITTPDAYKTYGRCGDILSVDTYPVQNGVITQVAGNVARACRQSDGDQPVWHCGQLFQWPGQRRPTPLEHRFMTYTALMAGAKGLLWYTYKGYGQYLPKDDPELWEAQKQLLKEIHVLAPVLMAEGTGEILPGDTGMMAVVKSSQDAGYLFAANTSETETITTTFNAGAIDPDVLEVFGENRKPELVDGRIRDTFKPLEVHIYRLK